MYMFPLVDLFGHFDLAKVCVLAKVIRSQLAKSGKSVDMICFLWSVPSSLRFLR